MIERIKPGVSKYRIAGYFTVLLFAFLFAVMLNASSAQADVEYVDSGKYNGIPWKLTSDYELIYGEYGKEYSTGSISVPTGRTKKVSFL